METNFEQKQQNLSDSQGQFLQPISRFYPPPNQIVSKNYSPDQKPVLKLIKPQQPQKITCCQLRNSYSMLFDQDDTLGYHYSYSLTHNIVYLKLNNKNYMKYKQKNVSHRFLAGLFIPPQRILSPDFKAHKNIYKTLNNIQYTQYKNDPHESFGPNCKSHGSDLRFSSNYQSGNLFIALKKKNFQYELVLQNDINSKGNNQWFNFMVDFRTEGRYKFTILNFTKSYSQFQKGMKILCYSFGDQQSSRCRWSRGGEKITYQESSIRRQDCSSRYYYSLKFQYQCRGPGKNMFCYFYPYNSLDLQKFLKRTFYKKINVHMKMEKIKVCETLSGQPVTVIHIFHKKLQKTELLAANNNMSPSRNGQSIPKTNRSVIFMARQHPGQTQGSFITEGVIEFLMQNGQMDYLKKNFDFYLFPMVNMDGVFYGNYRTNLSGTDLNRIWRNPRKDMHPEVFYLKKYLLNINYNTPISLIIDLHGHSKSFNSFFYGNPPKKDLLTGQIQQTKFFPYVCSKKIKQISFLQSTFSISQDKKNSARVVLSEYFPRALVYTLQNSFQGWKRQNGNIHDYTPQVLKKIGRQLVVTYLEYEKLLEKNPNIKQKWEKQIQQIKNKQTVKTCDKQKMDVGESDSQAGEQLINLCEDLSDPRQEQHSIFNRNNHLTNILKNKAQIQKIRQHRNIQINSQKKYAKYNRNMPSLQHSVGKLTLKKNRQNIPPALNTNYGFLSIVKIKTSNQIQNPFEPKSIQKRSDKDKIIHDRQNKNSLSCSDKNLPNKLTRENILDKLRKQNIKIQQAVNCSSGMKNFLQTMGIPLDRKYP